MSTPMEPFVGFPIYPTNNIGSTPTLVFIEEKTCIADGMLMVNTVDNPIRVFAYILVGSNQTWLAKGQEIEASGRIDILNNAVLNIPIGVEIYAYSDFSGNFFDCLISYQRLNELGGTLKYGRVK